MSFFDEISLQRGFGNIPKRTIKSLHYDAKRHGFLLGGALTVDVIALEGAEQVGLSVRVRSGMNYSYVSVALNREQIAEFQQALNDALYTARR